jgi:hypothetical protein
MSQLIESLDSFTIHFGGEHHHVNAELFSIVIQRLLWLTKASSKAVHPDSFIRLDIKAHNPGSFEAIIDTVIRYSDNLFTKDNAKVAAQVVGGVWAFLQIKKHLLGKRAESVETEGNTSTIINIDQVSLHVDNRISDVFFEDGSVDDKLSELFSALEESQNSDFSIQHDSNIMKFDKSDYPNMIQSVVSQSNKKVIEEPVEAKLLLRSADLIGNKHWQFVYHGKNISVSIEDKAFLKKVRSGAIKELYAGVKIHCLLDVRYEVNHSFELIEGTDRYRILEVLGDVVVPANQESFLDE